MIKPLSHTPAVSRVLQQIFVRQAREVLTRNSTWEGRVNLDHWNEAMFEILRPFLISEYRAGMVLELQRLERLRSTAKSYRRSVYKTIGARWDFVDPNVLAYVDQMVLQFVEETNRTASRDLNAAIADLRDELRQGLSQGESFALLTQRVRQIFTDPKRAYRIAVTESSRALNAGMVQSAKDSGVVKGFRWLASSDACPACLRLSNKEVGLDEPFFTHPKGGPYAVVYFPPLHPHCLCTVAEVIGTPPTRPLPISPPQPPLPPPPSSRRAEPPPLPQPQPLPKVKPKPAPGLSVDDPITPRRLAKVTLPDQRQIIFTPDPISNLQEYTTILVDPKKLDRAWAKATIEYIPPGGGGNEIPGRIAGFGEFLLKEKPVEAARVGFDVDGNVTFINGRHRFRYLTDHGAPAVAITVPVEHAAEFLRRFGVGRRGQR